MITKRRATITWFRRKALEALRRDNSGVPASVRLRLVRILAFEYGVHDQLDDAYVEGLLAEAGVREDDAIKLKGFTRDQLGRAAELGMTVVQELLGMHFEAGVTAGTPPREVVYVALKNAQLCDDMFFAVWEASQDVFKEFAERRLRQLAGWELDWEQECEVDPWAAWYRDECADPDPDLLVMLRGWLFDPGRILPSREALRAVDDDRLKIQSSVERHASGDWGDLAGSRVVDINKAAIAGQAGSVRSLHRGMFITSDLANRATEVATLDEVEGNTADERARGQRRRRPSSLGAGTRRRQGE